MVLSYRQNYFMKESDTINENLRNQELVENRGGFDNISAQLQRKSGEK